MFVSYCHPESQQRFFQDKHSTLPAWATDVRDETYMPNWAGLVPHPTDEYVHWGDKNPQKTMFALREAWEAICLAGLEQQALTLIGQAVSTARLDEAYNHQDFS